MIHCRFFYSVCRDEIEGCHRRKEVTTIIRSIGTDLPVHLLFNFPEELFATPPRKTGRNRDLLTPTNLLTRVERWWVSGRDRLAMVQNSRNSSGYYYGALGQEGCACLEAALETPPPDRRARDTYSTDVDTEWQTPNENPGGQEQQYYQGTPGEHRARLTKRRVILRIKENDTGVEGVSRLEKECVGQA
jgi:hypothetical protein